jgi:UDP-glucose 4-epimerase
LIENLKAVSRRRVLVVGAGFIGSAVVRELVDTGYGVTVLTRSEPKALSTYSDVVDVVIGDASEMETLAGLVADADHIVYALGSSSPAESEVDPASDVTFVLPPIIRLLELLRLRPSASLLYLSSGGAVYGNSEADRLTEDVTPAPISSYGLLKVTCERYVEMYTRRFGLEARILRVSNAYGPGQSWSGSQGVVAHLMRSAFTGERISLYGSAECVRDFIYVDDVAHVVSVLLEYQGGPLVVNVGSGIGHSIQQVRRTIEHVSGMKINVREQPARKFDVRRNVLDCSLICSMMTFEPMELEPGLARTWKQVVDVLDHSAPEMISSRAPAARRESR